jgi:beta-galactosidase
VLLPTYRVKAGGDSFIDDNGNFWQSDFGLSAAATFGSSSHEGNILGLGVYHTGRSSALGPLEYHLPVPNGVYRVTAHFMEPYLAGKGKCIFDVIIEGEVKIADIDPIELAGTGKPLARSAETSVVDGTLDISFLPKKGFAIVNGVEIQPAIAPLEKSG